MGIFGSKAASQMLRRKVESKQGRVPGTETHCEMDGLRDDSGEAIRSGRKGLEII